MIRQPIVSVLGHVDHGKTTLLDWIRGTTVAEREAGLITQHIGATEIPIKVIEKICRGLLDKLKTEITLPGLLFIDTPGHEAFVTLRKRGGALADLAILVIDVTEGFQPQTIEAVDILRAYKTPFLVAANKIDKIHGWVSKKGLLMQGIDMQSNRVKDTLDNKIYELVTVLHERGFASERFDRVESYEKEIAIVPVSAKTGEGIPELLMMLTGLAQKFLSRQLEVEVTGPAKGTVLEMKEEHGLGSTIDVIIYKGMIKKGNHIVVGGKQGVITTKVRSLLKPRPLDEIRDPRFKFDAVEEVTASSGIKILAPNLSDAISGSPLIVADSNIKEAENEVKEEIEEVKITTDQVGVIVKADTLGSLEALINILQQKGVAIRIADVGDVSKRDVAEANVVKTKDPSKAVILAFNVRALRDAEDRAGDFDITIIQNNVIYKLVEDYETWVGEVIEEGKKKDLETVVRPGKIKLLPGYVFRHSKPAIVGIEVLSGVVKKKYGLINGEGRHVGTVKGLQAEGENIDKASKGQRVAISIEGPTLGRQIKEGDVLYTDISKEHERLLESKYVDDLSPDELEALNEIKKIKRRNLEVFN